MWYRKAIDFAQAKTAHSSVNDRLFPPTYKLCSTLAKYLKDRKIDVSPNSPFFAELYTHPPSSRIQ